MKTHGYTAGKKTFAGIYETWRAMRKRCYQVTHHCYAAYGGRGITICDRWRGKNGFANFFADMGDRPEGKTLDRIDVDGNYEPSNCRWATPQEQAANKRKHKEAIAA